MNECTETFGAGYPGNEQATQLPFRCSAVDNIINAMPRRLTDQERNARLRAFLEELGWDTQDVDVLVEAALGRALTAARAAMNTGPIPDYIKAGEITAQAAWERAFEAGFQACALAFWDDLVYSRSRRRDAAKGSRAAAAERMKDHSAVLQEADAYGRRHPDSSARETAQHVAKRLGMRTEAVRHIIRAKKRANR
jgi:hypothetical protein